MSNEKLSQLPSGSAIADADLSYWAQGGASVKQAASAIWAYIQAKIVALYNPRTALQSDTDFYVNATTGSNSNDGSIGAPWATTQHAVNVISSTIDTGGFTIINNLAAGSYAGFGGKSIVGGGIIGFVGAGRALTNLTKGPNDGIYNTGEIASWNVPTGNVRWFMDKLTYDASAPGYGGGQAGYIVGVSGFNLLSIDNYLASGTGDVGFNLGTNSFNSVVGMDEWSEISLGGTITISGGTATSNFFCDCETLCHADLEASLVFQDAASFTNFLNADFSGVILWIGSITGTVTDSFSLARRNSEIITFGTPLPASGVALADPSAAVDGTATPMTVSQLTTNFSASSYTGGRMFVTDSNATLAAGIGNAVVGGGTNKVPVYSDGTNWKIG